MEFLDQTRSFLWGLPLLLLIFGVGAWFTFSLKGVQFRYLTYAIKQVFSPKQEGVKGDISHFQALMTTLAGAIGTGSIVGVATGVVVGGLGALFWMWVTALFGMATKYAESVLAVKYRAVDKRGEMIGGPMEYMEKGLGWKKVASLFAFFGMLSAICTGNLVQANAISDAVFAVWNVNPWLTGCFVSFLVGLVVVGGVQNIGRVAGVLVPVMALFYLVGGAAVVAVHYERIPQAFSQIFYEAFNGKAAIGGAVGSTLMLTIQMGVARSIFSNEAGLGITSIAAAAAKTDSPGRQGLVTMTGALLSTFIVCTVTGLALATSGVVEGCGKNGACLAIAAFESSIWKGGHVVLIGLVLFSFSTVIAWAYYGEKCSEYLIGERSVFWYRLLFTLVLIPGAVIDIRVAWQLADISNALMAIPNLVALLALSRVVRKETKDFLLKAEEERS